MNRPSYLAPKTMREALAALSKPGAQAIAGGTDLIPRMRAGSLAPSKVVDLRLLSLDYIKSDGGQVRLGACVTHSQLLDSKLLADRFPALVQACAEIAGPPVRNRATLGGNLVNASPAADLAPPLLAFDAEVVLAKPGKERIVPLHAFFEGPGKTVLKNGELLREVRLPLPPRTTLSKFIKMGKRKAMAIAVVSVAVRMTLDRLGSVEQARIALGSVAPVPMRAEAAEDVLQGKIPTRELIAEAARQASAASSPISDLRASADYRRRMVEVLVRRALNETWSTAGRIGVGPQGEFTTLSIPLPTQGYEEIVRVLNSISSNWSDAIVKLVEKWGGEDE